MVMLLRFSVIKTVLKGEFSYKIYNIGCYDLMVHSVFLSKKREIAPVV